MNVLILGGGLAGISCSYHLGHDRCCIVDRNTYLGGHAHTHFIDNSLWDEGPHVSFTKHKSVRELLDLSADSELLSFPAVVGNYFYGSWIRTQLNVI